MTFAPSNTYAVFLPTTINFPKDPDELFIGINKMYEDISTRLNVKDVAIYNLVEVVTGQNWFTAGNPQIFRLGFRTVYNIGPIAAGATSTTAHNLTGVTAFTFINGAAITDFPDNRPIPFASVTAVNQQIEIEVDATNITIKNGAAAPNITSAIVVLEYLKN